MKNKMRLQIKTILLPPKQKPVSQASFIIGQFLKEIS